MALTDTLRVRLEPAERAELEKLANLIDRTPSAIVRRLIRAELERARKAKGGDKDAR